MASLSEFTTNKCKLLDILPTTDYELIDFSYYNSYFSKNNINGEHEYWCNRTRFKDCFNYIINIMNDQEVSIIHPFTKNIMKTDFYFLITGLPNVLGNDLYCCYYFKSTNLVLIFNLGSGLGSMNTNTYNLLCLNERNIFCSPDLLIDSFIFDKILLKKNEIDKLEDYEYFLRTIPKENTTFYGFHNNLGHQIFNDYSGIFLLQKTDIFNKTNNFILGPNNVLNFYEYFKNSYSEKNIIKCDDINTYDNMNGRGIVYKYNHHFISEDMRKYLHNNILNNKLLNVSNSFEMLLKKMELPVIKLLIVLRCGSRNMVDQENTIIKFIHLFKKKFTKSIILLGGFTTNNLSNDHLNVGYFNQKYEDIRNLYIETSNNIINNSNIPDIYSINNFNFKESCIISNECHFAIYQHGSASTIGAWLYNIPGITIGFHDVARYIYMDKCISENNKVIYLEDKNIITFDVHADHLYTFNLNADLFYNYFEIAFTPFNILNAAPP